MKIRDCIILKVLLEENKEINYISKHTENTWQANRSIDEIVKDTKNGKLAEIAVQKLLESNLPENFIYITYDSFRTDDFNKHAPFDGILYNLNLTSKKVVDLCIDRINKEVSKNEYGNISIELRKYCELHKIYFVEIKSTNVTEKRKNIAKEKELYSESYFNVIINEIFNDDFLAYPYLCRNSEFIMCWDDYAKFIQKKMNIESLKKAKTYSLKKSLDNMSDILIRVYLLENYAIIIGYTTKYDLLTEPNVGKCFSLKSARAIYYKQSLKERKTISSLHEDKLLWE